eukprot:11174379-Lingulodinium_polyedra.AAC.1
MSPPWWLAWVPTWGSLGASWAEGPWPLEDNGCQASQMPGAEPSWCWWPGEAFPHSPDGWGVRGSFSDWRHREPGPEQQEIENVPSGERSSGSSPVRA